MRLADKLNRFLPPPPSTAPPALAPPAPSHFPTSSSSAPTPTPSSPSTPSPLAPTPWSPPTPTVPPAPSRFSSSPTPTPSPPSRTPNPLPPSTPTPSPTPPPTPSAPPFHTQHDSFRSQLAHLNRSLFETTQFTAAPLPLPTALPGHLQTTSRGALWRTEYAHPLDALHGTRPLAATLATPFTALEEATGDPRLRAFDPAATLYLDIETTGLDHGAGTVAFMIGLGTFESGCFVVRQLILRDHEDEAAQLTALWEAVLQAPFLATFNGKSFDLTVLQGRLALHRICSPAESALKLRPHFDLIHTSRALFRGLWPDTRLQRLERELLGFHRTDDMPGSLAPTCYFHWLHTRDAAPLAAVGLHNRWDIISLAALAGVLAAAACPAAVTALPATVGLNLAALYLRRRAFAAVLATCRALPRDLSPDQHRESLELMLKSARRLGDDALQLATLRALQDLGPDDPSLARAAARIEKRLRRQA